MQLRPYQDKLLNEIRSGFKRSGSVILQLPTGGGKTHIAASLARGIAADGQRVWFICHRREIIRQTGAALGDAGVDHGFYAPGLPANNGAPVKVSSADYLRGRAEHFGNPDVVIWDECHHIAARTWAGLKDKFGNAKHIGLTATPSRLDGVGLGDYFDTLICGPDTRQLIEWGFLSSYRLFAPTVPDLRGIKTCMGDYARDELSERMSAPTLIGDAIDHYQRIAPNARALVFATSVNASKAIVDRFQAAGIKSAHVDGKTPTADRDAAVKALEAGDIHVLSNVEVFTEGFDLPAIDAVILLRPTRSFALYRQMIGRGLRTAEGKRETVILDHAGLIYQHGLPDEFVQWSLEGTAKQPAHKTWDRTSLRCCPECAAVHVFKTDCPECGYVYKMRERTIDEVYGDLVEVRYRPGFETQAAFAHRVGKHPQRVYKWARKGLPVTENGMVHVQRGLEWLEQWSQRPMVKGRYDPQPRREPKPAPIGATRADFARLARVGTATIPKLIEDGLPLHDDGSIDGPAAMEWMKANRRAGTGVSPPDGHETCKGFARMVGRKTARNLIKWGLPIEPNGFVNIDKAMAWWKSTGRGERDAA